MIDLKIVERIKKLLELSTSPNENEARSAMDMAQRLMLQYSISESELHPNDCESAIVMSEYWNNAFSRQGVIDNAPTILNVICPIFGVHALIRSRLQKVSGIDMFGFITNLDIARFALDSIFAQGSIEARIAYKKYRTTTFGDSFWRGYAIGIHEKFSQYKEASNGIALYDKVKAHRNQLAQGTFKPLPADTFAQESGRNAGLRAELRRGITQSNTGKLLKN